jgi:hypothetical protein
MSDAALKKFLIVFSGFYVKNLKFLSVIRG